MSAGQTALTAVQTAVMAVLATDGTLLAAVPGGVWDYVPSNPTWPYLCLESAEEVPDDTYGKQGRRVRLTFAVFSTFQGRAEQFAVVDCLVRLLRYAPLGGGSPDPLAGWEHLLTLHLGSQAISPFEVGNTRAGGSLVTFEVYVLESTP